jgi:hypothetical protein
MVFRMKHFSFKTVSLLFLSGIFSFFFYVPLIRERAVAWIAGTRNYGQYSTHNIKEI